MATERAWGILAHDMIVPANKRGEHSGFRSRHRRSAVEGFIKGQSSVAAPLSRVSNRVTYFQPISVGEPPWPNTSERREKRGGVMCGATPNVSRGE
jgi:hypothetical protein